MQIPQSAIGNRISTISLLVAMSENRVIGRGNALPWRLPADLKRFKQLTTGHPVVMGRKTFESIGRPLPHRRNIVITRNPAYNAAGVEIVHDFNHALDLAGGEEELFIIGGAEVYKAALPIADRIHLTRVLATIEGDAFFPLFEGPGWKLTERSEHPADDKHAYAMSFEVYGRVRGLPPITSTP